MKEMKLEKLLGQARRLTTQMVQLTKGLERMQIQEPGEENRQVAIKKWLLDQGLTQAQFAREAGVSEALVSLVIKGKKGSPRVLAVLKKHGCPQRFLVSPAPQDSVAMRAGGTGGKA